MVEVFCAGFEQSSAKCYTSCFVSGCTLTRGLTVVACSANLKPMPAPVITSQSLPKSSHPVLMTSGPSGSGGLEGSETLRKCLKTAILKKTGKDDNSSLVLFLFLLILHRVHGVKRYVLNHILFFTLMRLFTSSDSVSGEPNACRD